MVSKILDKFHLILLGALLPFLSGCGGGGGVAALGSLFASLGTGGLNASASTGFLSLGGESVATVVNPEPASMLLVGGGLVTMAYFKAKQNNHKV